MVLALGMRYPAVPDTSRFACHFHLMSTAGDSSCGYRHTTNIDAVVGRPIDGAFCRFYPDLRLPFPLL